MTTKNLIPRASGEGGIGITDVTWGYGYYDTGNFNKGLFVKGSGIEDVIANTVTQGGLGGEWTKAVNGLDIYYNGGNVGIGTSDPGVFKTVFNNNNADTLVKIASGTDKGAALFFGEDAGSGGTPAWIKRYGSTHAVKPNKVEIGAVGTGSWVSIQGDSNDVLNIKGSGNVGIGTTNPGGTLELLSTLTDTNLLMGGTPASGTREAWRFQAEGDNLHIGQDKSSFAKYLTLKGGNVGIGTANPGAKLELADANNKSVVMRFRHQSFNGSYGASTELKSIGSNLTYGTDFTISNRDLNGTFQERLRVDYTGNVGIGTASPSSLLHITSNDPETSITSENARCITIQDTSLTDNALSLINFNTKDGKASAQIGSRAVHNVAGHNVKSDIFFATRDSSPIPPSNVNSFTEKMTIKQSGNVGIGTTNPGNKLHISAVSGESPSLLRLSHETSTTEIRFTTNRALANESTHFIQAYNDNLRFFVGGGATADIAMAINSNGNVGIGTTNPTADLHINSKATQTAADMSVSALRFQNGDSWDNSVLINGRTDTTGATDYTDRVGLMIATKGNERIRITSAGYVGIGTPDPVGALDVVGKVYFSKIPCSNNTVPASLFTGAEMNFQAASGTFGTGKSKDIGIAFRSLHGAGGTGVGETDLVLGSINPQGSNQEIMKLHSDGRVRIGRKSSENSLAGQQFYGALVPGGSLEIRNEKDTNAATAQLRIVGGSGLNNLNGGQAVTGSLYIDNGGQANTVGKFKISQDIIGGEIHVVSSSGGVKLTSGATSWVAASDETLKENIKPLENVLDKIKDYRCVEYNLKNSPEDKKIGFIAQDWVDDFNPIVNKDEEDVLGMKYTETIPVLLKAIQEQQQLIEDLKSRIETLENK